jgi:site-specific DNA-methyltransferase (cytosine-N4-specific)
MRAETFYIRSATFKGRDEIDNDPRLTAFESTEMSETTSKAHARAIPEVAIAVEAIDADATRGLISFGDHPASLIPGLAPTYRTSLGAAFCGDGLDVLRAIPTGSLNLVITSPPYALHFKKEYGNVDKQGYVEWMLPFAVEIKRILKKDGSFVLNIGGSYNPGQPTRSLYHFKLLIALCDHLGFHLAQECFWYNPAKLPAPAEWVNVRRARVKDSVEYVWWLAPSPWPTADNRRVLVPYSGDMVRLIARGFKSKKRPSGHNITPKFRKNQGGAIPANVVIRGNNESNSDYIKACADLGVKVHPARFPSALPEFFLNLLTRPGDVVLDPFAGSNTTGRVAESLDRRWIAVDLEEAYVRASAIRFGLNPHAL